jgi:recombination protein U
MSQNKAQQKVRNYLNRERGKAFEQRIDASLEYYRSRGYAAVEKTPEPMKPLKDLGQGKFIACYEKKAQADYKGVMKGGREVVFEAKYTASDRLTQDRVTPEQTAYMNEHTALGARCYVIGGFASGNVYLIPWSIWVSMKDLFGHKYVTEKDIYHCKINTGWNGTLMLFP